MRAVRGKVVIEVVSGNETKAAMVGKKEEGRVSSVVGDGESSRTHLAIDAGRSPKAKTSGRKVISRYSVQ